MAEHFTADEIVYMPEREIAKYCSGTYGRSKQDALIATIKQMARITAALQDPAGRAHRPPLDSRPTRDVQ